MWLLIKSTERALGLRITAAMQDPPSQGVSNEPISKCREAASSCSARILKYSLTSSLSSSYVAPEVSPTRGYELHGSDERRIEPKNPSLRSRGLAALQERLTAPPAPPGDALPRSTGYACGLSGSRSLFTEENQGKVRADLTLHEELR